MDWWSTVVNGALLGGLYGLFGLGLALVFGVMRVVNLAHADAFVVVGSGALSRAACRASHSTSSAPMWLASSSTSRAFKAWLSSVDRSLWMSISAS